MEIFCFGVKYKSKADLARKYNISYGTLRGRLRSGYTVEDAVLTTREETKRKSLDNFNQNHKSLTEEEVKKRFEKYGYKIIEYTYKNNRTNVLCYDKNGYRVYMNLINEYRKFLNHSKYGGILYIINLLLIIWITIYIIQALFSCLFYKRLTPEDYEVGYVKSYTTSQQTDDVAYLGLEKEVTGKSVKENLEADFDYFKEKKIDLKSLQYTQFDSDCTHYVYISDGNGNGITYYITVKDGKYKLDLRYRM